MSEQIPRIVTSRLALGEARLDRDSHPDPDLLTAFTEQALLEGERLGVLRHLAGCADCRAVVALAQPEIAEAAGLGLVAPRGSPGVWIWRWGALAACAALAVSLVVRQHGNHSPTLAELTNSASGSAARLAGKPSPSVRNGPAPDMNSDATLRGSLPPDRRAAPLSVEPLAPEKQAEAVTADKILGRNDLGAGLGEPSAAGTANQPAAGAVDELKADAAASFRKKSAMSAVTVEAVAAAPAVTPEVAHTLSKAKVTDQVVTKQESDSDATSSFAQAGRAAAPTPVAPTERSEYRASSAPLANIGGFGGALQASTWQLTDAGNLQRSFDGGKNWESVSVSRPGRLRVVASIGFHIWVGGNGGLLLRSEDGGNHFTAVNLSQNGTALAGDIVILNFPDAQHGRLETSAHEVWTTTDGGLAWQPSSSGK